MAQLVIAAAGAAIGGWLAPTAIAFGITGAQAGWVIGSLIGSTFGPRQKSIGPKLDDLRVTGAEYGQAIPWIAGSPRLAGQLWWASERRPIETTETQGGKGGGGVDVTTTTYDVDLLIGLTDNQADGITRVWWNGKLVWTNLPDADDQSIVDSNNGKYWERITFYDGSTSQGPDPIYEAAVTTAQAIGYRGRATVFLQSVHLGQGGQLPQLTFETASALEPATTIVRQTQVIDTGHTFSSSGVVGLGVPAITAMQPEIRVVRVRDGTNFLYNNVWRFNLQGEYQGATTRSGGGDNYPGSYGTNGGPNESGGPYYSSPVGILGGHPVRAQDWFYAIGTADKHQVVLGQLNDIGGVAATGADLSITMIASGRFFGGMACCSDGIHFIMFSAPTATYFNNPVIDQWHLGKYEGGLTTALRNGTMDASYAMSSLCLGNSSSNNASSFRAGMLEDDLIHLWTSYGAGDHNTSMYTIGEDDVLRFSSELMSGNGTYPRSFSYDTIWAESGFAVVFNAQSFAAFIRGRDSISEVSLSTVVNALCLRAGLTGIDFDISGLSSITKPVRALAVSQVGPTRQVLEALRGAFFFDIVLRDKIYFKARASASVVTIPYTDLGTGADEMQQEPLELITDNDLELPAQIALRYSNILNDYQIGTEYSDRLLVDQTSTNDVTLPLALTPTEAKEIADAMSADAVASLTHTTIHLGLKYSRLEPTDVVTVIGRDSSSYRMRLTTRRDKGAYLEYDAVIDDANVVTPAVVTSQQYIQSVSVRAASAAAWNILDIPILQDKDDVEGVYVAARGSTSVWPGCNVYSSASSTLDFLKVASVEESAVMGFTTTTLGNWTGGDVFDEVNSVTVSVAHGVLASASRDLVIESPTVNALLVGDEIIQFVTATQQSADPNVYKLTRLLRGCRGTEAAMSTHTFNDRVVLLQFKGLRRIAHTIAEIDVPLYYKAVTNGSVIADVSPVTATDTNKTKKPFAPTNLRVQIQGNGDFLFTWDRRTRSNSATLMGDAGINSPLFEDTEKYRLGVYPTDLYDVPVFAGVFTEAQATYTATAYFTDFVLGRTFPLNTFFMQVDQVGDVNGTPTRTAVPIPFYQAGGGSYSGSQYKKLRALFWYDTNTNITSFVDAFVDPGGYGDKSMDVYATTMLPVADRPFVELLPFDIAAIRKNKYRTGVEADQIKIGGYNFQSVAYDDAADRYFCLHFAISTGPFYEVVITPDGVVESSTNITMVTSGVQQLDAPLLVKFGGLWRAFCRNSFGRWMTRAAGAPTWTVADGNFIVALKGTGYTPTISGAVVVNISGIDTLFLLVHDFTGSAGTQQRYCSILITTDCITFTKLTTYPDDSLQFPRSYFSNGLCIVGGKVTHYYSSSTHMMVGQYDTGSSSWVTAGVLRGTSPSGHLSNITPFIGGVAAYYTQDRGLATARSKMSITTGGVTVTDVADANLLTEGFADGIGEYKQIINATNGDLRAPLIGAGTKVLFERQLEFSDSFLTHPLNPSYGSFFAVGGWAVLQKHSEAADSKTGFFAMRVGGEPFITATMPDAVTAAYLPGLHLYAVDPATDRFVAYLRVQGNASTYRTVIAGKPYAIKKSLSGLPDLSTDPPVGFGWTGTKFIMITTGSNVYHSTAGTSWSSAGTLSGGPTIINDPFSFRNAFMVMVAGVLVMRFGNEVYYNTALDGITWSAATGAVVGLPSRTLPDNFALYGIAASASGDVGVIVASDYVSGTATGKIYSTTDGMAWTESYSGARTWPQLGGGDSAFNSGIVWCKDKFDVNFWDSTLGGSNNFDVVPIVTVGGDEVRFNLKAASGVATSRGYISIGTGFLDWDYGTPYFSYDGTTWSATTWSD